MEPRRLIAGAGILVLMALSTACDRGTKIGASGPAEVSTTVAPTTTTTVALVPQKSPTAAVAALLAAWRKGDRAGALQLAAPPAVDALFARPPMPTSDRGCTEPLNGSSDCAYRYGAGVLNAQAAASGGGWVVRTVVIEQ